MGNLLRDPLRDHADPLDELPWKRLMHQELGLLPFLHLGCPEVQGSDGRPVHLIELADLGAELGVGRPGIGE